MTLTSSLRQTFVDKPSTVPRKQLAKSYLQAKNTQPQHYLSADCVVDELPRLQMQLADTQKKTVSFLDIIIKASAVALRQVPEANAVWENVRLTQKASILLPTLIFFPFDRAM